MSKINELKKKIHSLHEKLNKEKKRLDKQFSKEKTRINNEIRDIVFEDFGKRLSQLKEECKHPGDFGLDVDLDLEDRECNLEYFKENPPEKKDLVIGEYRECITSPTGFCVYDEYHDPCFDFCIFCGEPEERK